MSTKRTILIVEDDQRIREMLAERLADEQGFAVLTSGTLHEADEAINHEDSHVDAVILDVGMPDGDGLAFCAKLRRLGHGMPIIMLTGLADEAHVVHGLECGANDYIAKPFRTNELVARIRAQLREFENSEDASFPVGPYLFRPSKRLLQERVTKHRVRLTAIEATILKFLYHSNGRPVDRRIIMQEVWGHNITVMTHTLETHIYRMRQKMEADPANPVLLETLQDGYRLNPELASVGEV
jgi:DNA-binding response OmpR family regulator